MPVGYHVDRSNTLEVGDSLELEDGPIVGPDDRVLPDEHEASAIESFYPGGLSRHGVRYAYLKVGPADNIDIEGDITAFTGVCQFENSGTGNREHRNRDPTDALYEWVFELVRRGDFPDRPSRFQSFFGFETAQEALAFQSQFGPNAQIVAVEYNECYRADMDLVACQSFADGLHKATTYWRGEPKSEDPTWELLMQSPVEVIDIRTE